MDTQQSQQGQAPPASNVGAAGSPPIQSQPIGGAQQPAQPGMASQQIPQAAAQAQPIRPAVDSPGVRPARSMVRRLLGIVAAALFALAFVLIVRLFMAFFEPLRTMPIYETVSAATTPLVLPLGIKPIATPFQGFFEVNTALTILAILVVEYLVGAVRRNT